MPKYLPLPDGSSVTIREGETPQEAYARAQEMYPEAFAPAKAKTEPTVGGQVKEFFKGLAPGAVGLLESAAVGASALLPEETEKRAREGIAGLAATAKKPFEAAPGYEDTVGRKVGEAAGSIVPFLGLGPFGLAGRVGMAGLGTGAGAGEARTRAEQEGATAEQRSTATGLGAVVGISEMFAPMRILGRIDEPIKQGVVAGLKRVAMAGGEEALQEAASQAAQNLIAKGIYKPEQEIVEQVGESAAYGGAVGALAQGLIDMTLGRRARKAGAKSEIEKARAEADAARAEEEARKADPDYPRQFITDYDSRKEAFTAARKALKKPGKDATPDVWAVYDEQRKAVNELREGLAKDAKEYNTLKTQLAPILAAEAEQAKEAEKQAQIQADLAKLREEQTGQALLPGFEAETVTPPTEVTTPTETVDYAEQARKLTAYLEEIRSQAAATTVMADKIALAQRERETKAALAEATKLAEKNPAVAINRLVQQMQTATENGDVQQQEKIAKKLQALGVEDISNLPPALDLGPALRLAEPESKGAFAARVYKPGPLDIEAQEQETLAEAEQQREVSATEAERERKVAPEVAALQRMGQKPAGLTNILALPELAPATPQGSAAMAMMDQRLRLEEAGLTTARTNRAEASETYRDDPTPENKKRLENAEAIVQAAQERYDALRQNMLQNELIPTGEEEKPPAPRVIQKAPSEGFKLHPRQGAPVSPSDYQSLSTRLASALARDDIDQPTYEFLRRAEKVLPSIDTRIETQRQKGAAKDTASTEGFLTLLDKQLALIETGKEGVYTSDRYLEKQRERASGTAVQTVAPSEASGRDVKSYRTMSPEDLTATKMASRKRAERIPAMPGGMEVTNVPGAPVTERVGATTGATLHLKPTPLSLSGELEPLLRLQEQLAGPDIAESTQGELFKTEATGVVRSTPANFAKYLQSKEVKALRDKLPKIMKDVKAQQQAIPALQKRVDELKKRLQGMNAAAKEHKSAVAVLNANKDLANLQRGIEDIQRAITAKTVERINIDAQIQEIGYELGRLEGARAAFIAPDSVVTKKKNVPNKSGIINIATYLEFAPDYRGSELETTLLELENKTLALRSELEKLLSDKTVLDSSLQELNRYVEVIQARNKVAELRDKAPFGYEIDQAKEQLRAAELNLGTAQEAVGKVQAATTVQQGKERRQQEAIAQARRTDESLKRAQEEQRRLESMYSEKTEGQQVQFDPNTQARQLAAEMKSPTYSANERVELVANPNKVLGGYYADVTKLQKQIDSAKNASLAARKKELAPLQNRLAALETKYKNTKSAEDRAALLPNIEQAADALQAAITRQAETQITWKGMGQQIRDLAVALNKVEDLETKLGVGRVVDPNAPERQAPVFRPTKAQKAAAKRESARLQAEEAGKRAGAPTTSGEALTRTEAKKAEKAQKTVYTGKGVGTDVASSKKTGKKPAVFRTATTAGPSLKEQTIKRITDKVVEGWTNVPEITIVADENGLPENIRAQAEAEGMIGKIPGLYDTATGKVYLVASNLKTAEDVVLTIAHEIAGHFGLRSILGNAYAKTMNRLYDGNRSVRERADVKLKENPTLSKEVAVEEVLADMAETGATPQERNLLQKVIDFIKNKIVARFPGLSIDKISDNEVKQIVANARNYVKEGATGKIEGGTAATSGLVYRTAKYASPEMAAAGDALDPFVSKNKSWWEKTKANLTGLAFETQLVDRFAGFERLSKYLPEHMGTQMMYYLRMYDQRMNMVSQAVANGAPRIVEKTRPDGKIERIIEAKAGPSIKGVVNTLKDANPMVGNAEAVNRLFTAYMAGIRANNKGFDSLHFGEDVTQADLDKALSVVNNNKALKDIFDKARGEYNEYNRNLVNFLVETGALNKKVADRLTAENDYIPFYREQNGVAQLLIGGEAPIRIGSIKEQPYLHELVGGDQPILDFLTSSVQNTNLLVDMGMRNIATKNAVFELVNLNAAKFVRGTPSGKDVVKFKIDGKDQYAVLATERVKIGNKEFDTGIPADIVVKGMEGIPTQMPFIFRAMAMPAQLLRKGVTLSPLYMARQLFRDSLAAPILSGADFTPMLGALKQIGSPAKETLERRGIVGGQQFHGTSADLSMILRDVAEGKPGWMSLLAKAEAKAMEADALTRRAQYNSYIEQGLSEMEATLMALESMNFNKRGASPSIHIANALIPFFNAQIQGLNVLYKAMTGKMPFNDKLKIRKKLLERGGMMATAAVVYAMMMQDDEAYENATPDQKYGNWFVRIPGVDEPLRIPVPFEVGYIFKALPEALVNSMTTEHGGEEAVKAFKQIVLQTIPGGSSYGMPQALKPAIEVGLGKSFYTGRDILSAREKELLPEEQFRANTTEIAKAFGKLTGTSPIMVEQLVKGYTGTMGLAFLQALSVGVPPGESPEAAVKRLSDYPVFGSAFQPNDAGGIINSVYERMSDAKKVADTYTKMLEDGRVNEAEALLQRRGEDIMQNELGKEFRSNMQQLTAAERAIQAADMPAAEKRKQLDELRRLKISVAKTIREVSDQLVSVSFSL